MRAWWPIVTKKQNKLIGNRECRVYLSPYLPIIIFGPEQGIKLVVIIDSRVAINRISKELCDYLGLLILAAIEYNICLVKGLLSKLDSVVDKVSI